MSLPLYTDHNIDLDIVIAVRRFGIDVLIARDDSADRLADDLLLERAVNLGRVLCTADKDFLRITRRWWDEGREFPGVIYVDQAAASVGNLAEDIAIIATTYPADEMRNQLVWVPLR